MKTKLQSWGFTSGHMQLIGIAVAVFAILIFTQTNVHAHLHGMFSKADNTQPELTYEQVREQVLTENNSASSNELLNQQIALLSRTDDNGKVLGDAIGIGTIPTADQIFERDQLDQIHVYTVPTTQASIRKYSEGVLQAESQNDAISMLANLNSSDPAVLRATEQQANAIVKNLAALQVPTELADYNRYKMIYYQTLSRMAEAFATNKYDSNFQEMSKILFSLMDKIESTKTQISTKYQVDL